MISSDDHRLARALEVLKREQEALSPSRAQIVRYHLLNAAAAAMVLTLILLLVYDVLDLSFVTSVVNLDTWLAIYFLLSGAMIVLLIVNIPLMWRFWQQATLRRHLGIAPTLKAMRRMRPRSLRTVLPFVGIGAALAFVLGFLLVLLGTAADAIFIVTIAPLGLALLSIWLMRRSRETLEMVRELQDSLTPDLATSVAEKIGQIERDQIIEDRQRSVRSAPKKGEAPSYTVKQSRDVLSAKGELDPHTYQRVEDQIFQLMAEPQPEGIRKEPATGLFVRPVPETSLEVNYAVDEESRTVKIFYLTSSDTSDAGGGINA